MPSYREIYDHHAAEYDDLVRHEDHPGSLRAWFARAFPEKVDTIVELGCGTGRVTRMLAPHARALRAYDGAEAMIAHARTGNAHPEVSYGVAMNASLPEPDGVAQAVVAGWTIGHVTGFHPEAWAEHAALALDEMDRVAAPGARLVVVETLGTCRDAPGAPNPRLEALYEVFERERGFSRDVLDTSYAFASVGEAARIMGFFFGDDMRRRVTERGAAIVPEWTGVWTRVK